MRAGKRAALFARRNAAAKVQLRRENHFQPASQGIGHALEQRFGGSLTHLLGITADGGQVQAVFVDKRGIVKADDADILLEEFNKTTDNEDIDPVKKEISSNANRELIDFEEDKPDKPEPIVDVEYTESNESAGQIQIEPEF